jgi:23S rRNA pseudoU1915 N3-methylase RlmH
MRIRFVWVGKTRNEHLRALCDEYLKRLGRFARCEVQEVRESAQAAKEAGI